MSDAVHTPARKGPEPPDLTEKGGMKDGQPQRSNDRLFMQFLAFGGCQDTAPLADTLARAKIDGVLYEDVNDPRGIGLLSFSPTPSYFVDRVRPILNETRKQVAATMSHTGHTGRTAPLPPFHAAQQHRASR